MVRAKFKVNRIERTLYSAGVEVQTIVLSPVYGGNDPEHENYKFWKATPSGEIRLGTVNAKAAAEFDLEAEFYVEFTRAND